MRLLRPLLAVALAGFVDARRGRRAGTATPAIPFTKYTLRNGLEVILAPDKRLPTVAVNLWYHVGAANETPDRTGFAHLFEHMMFTGTKHIARGQAERLLEAAGGSDSNASTGSTAPTTTTPCRRTSSRSRCGRTPTAWGICSTRSTEGARQPAGRRAQRAPGNAPRTGPTASSTKRSMPRCSRPATPIAPTSSARTPTSRRRSSTMCATSSSATTVPTTPRSSSQATSTRRMRAVSCRSISARSSAARTCRSRRSSRRRSSTSGG